MGVHLPQSEVIQKFIWTHANNTTLHLLDNYE